MQLLGWALDKVGGFESVAAEKTKKISPTSGTGLGRSLKILLIVAYGQPTFAKMLTSKRKLVLWLRATDDFQGRCLQIIANFSKTDLSQNIFVLKQVTILSLLQKLPEH